jgi:homoserine kinase
MILNCEMMGVSGSGVTVFVTANQMIRAHALQIGEQTIVTGSGGKKQFCLRRS